MGNSSSKITKEQLVTLSKSTNFTEKELKAWHKGFAKDCPNGLTSKEMLQIYKNYFPFGDVTKYAGLVFKHLDTNKDGIVDFTEFITAMSIAKGTQKQKLECKFLINKGALSYTIWMMMEVFLAAKCSWLLIQFTEW